MNTLTIPSSYTGQYEAARQYDQSLVDNYLRHTTMGDSDLDMLIDELVVGMRSHDLERFIGAGIEQRDDVLRKAPQALRDFFDQINTPPPWLDYQAFSPAIRAFNKNVDHILVAFVTGVLVEGFSTLIAKSFSITGRVGETTRRLKQNNRHMMEIFYFEGLHRENDGWKLSVRIRFIHARIRGLLRKSGAWDEEAWGTPVSAAHLGFAISVFSHRMLEYSRRVGAKYSAEEQTSFLTVWRYAGYLMGIPQTILYTNASEAEKIYKVAYLCEPEPDADSIAVANLLIRSIPFVVNVKDPVEQENLRTLAYRLSRALIGEQHADSLGFPKYSNVLGTLFLFRMKERFKKLMHFRQVRLNNFSQLLEVSVYDDHGLSYRMPDHAHTSKSKEW